MKYLDESGLSHLWDKIKDYVAQHGGSGGCPFPVNGIYMSMDSSNPSTIWEGTTWERIAVGKTLVGVDENDTDFAEAELTGGSKGAWYHDHTTVADGGHTHRLKGYGDVLGSGSKGWRFGSGGSQWATGILETSGSHSHTVNSNGSSNNKLDVDKANMPPYMTCYIWQRTT